VIKNLLQESASTKILKHVLSKFAFRKKKFKNTVTYYKLIKQKEKVILMQTHAKFVLTKV